MGWYGAWRLIERHGSPAAVPTDERREFLLPEADPSRTWSLACAAARGEWPGGPETRLATQLTTEESSDAKG